MSTRADLNDLAYWFPKIQEAGLPVPETRILHTDSELMSLLDGQEPDPPGSFRKLCEEITAAAVEINGDDFTPFFLRTGHGSGKHEWEETCLVPSADPDVIGYHVAALVEWSANVDLFGLPTQTWVARQLLDTMPLFYCDAYQRFPVTREFRVFIRDGVPDGVFPYWPEGAVEQGNPDDPRWRELLADASKISQGERIALFTFATRACAAVGGGYWSIDFLQDANRRWWLCDMADGDRSWRADRT
jgi:hypothetical protein